jgi:NADH-quinone oxidoreductase subunit N
MTSYMHLLQLAMPEVIVVVTALFVLTADLLAMRASPVRSRLAVAAGLASTGCAAAILSLVLSAERVNIFDGMFVANPLTQVVQIALLVLTIFVLLLAVDATFTEHVGEFVLLILLATGGMMFLVASQNLLTSFISLELLSLPLYILTGFDKRSSKSSEAALKYFLFGGMSAAFLLFGFSLLYGFSNSLNFPQIAAAIHAGPLNPLLVIAIVTTVIGLGFKVAAVPLHFWAPDAYEAAPIPVAAFIASGSKVASFFVFFQIFALAFAGAEGSAAWMHPVEGWAPIIAAVAALSMLLGNMAAIVQSSLRRLLAYSAIAHAGYMLIAIVAHTPQSLAALLFYVITYALATIGAFGVIGIVEAGAGSDHLANFNGLHRRSPILSACLFVFLLSLAGIPPLAGFFGKFFLFVAALGATSGLLWLVVLAIAMSAVSLYYYLRVLKRVYSDSNVDAAPIPASPFSVAVVVLLAAGVVLFGCAPNLLLQWILNAIHG